LLQRNRNAIGQVPGVRIVTIQTTKLTSRRPCDKANTWPVHSRAGSEGMKETDVSRGQRCPNISFRKVSAGVHPELEWGCRFQRRIVQLLKLFFFGHGTNSRGTCG